MFRWKLIVKKFEEITTIYKLITYTVCIIIELQFYCKSIFISSNTDDYKAAPGFKVKRRKRLFAINDKTEQPSFEIHNEH